MINEIAVEAQNQQDEDGELIQKIRTGCFDSFDALFEKYVGRVYNSAMKFLRNEAEAEDLVQEVFLSVFQKCGSFRRDCAFSHWLHRLTVNAAISRIRKRKRVKEQEYIEEYLPKFQEDGHHLTRPVTDWSKGPENRLLENEVLKNFEESLEMLNPIEKAIVLMSDLEGLTNREIAETLDLTIPAVKAKLHRGRLFLRGKLAVFLGHSSH